VKFEHLIAKYVTGNLTTKDLPQVALVAMDEGLESESTIILAGLEKNENSFVIESYFNLAIKELGLTIPGKRDAALKYAIGISQEVINGEKDLITGVSEIYQKALGSYNFFGETKEYAYDSIYFERVYGLYDEYDDLTNELVQISGDYSREKLMAENRQELIKELIAWKEKLSSII
jgi:hypothetical protein